MTGGKPWQQLTLTENEQRLTAARVVAAQRRDPTLSLTAAARREGISARTVLRYFGDWYRRDPDGLLRPLPHDSEPFLMNVFSTRGVVEVEASDSEARALIGAHTAAIGQFRDTGNTAQLMPFHGQRVGGATLETDPDRLLALVWTTPEYLEIYAT